MGKIMDYFNCEHCDEKTHFEASYQTIADGVTRLFRIATVCDVANDCVCIPCGKFYNLPRIRMAYGLPPQLLTPEYSNWCCDRYAAKKQDK